MSVNSLEIKSHFTKEIVSYIKKTYPEIHKNWPSIEADISNSIVVPKENQGDLSSSICFVLAKRAKASPMKIAEDMVKHLSKDIEREGVVKKLDNANGYVNLWLNEISYSEFVLNGILTEKKAYGRSTMGKEKRVITEFPSVNPNKPWHIGHLRNALLGDSISNILAFCGYEVEREDYIDDLGLQMAEILWGEKDIMREIEKQYSPHIDASAPFGWKLSIPNKKEIKKFDQFLGEEYVKINKKIIDKKAEGEVNSILKKMEEIGSTEQLKDRDISEKSVKDQYETAFSYGIYHDVLIWESDLIRNELLKTAMKLLSDKKITKIPKEGKFKGCVVVELDSKLHGEGDEENVKVFIRSNGVATYIAKDFAFHMWKLGMLKADFKYEQFIIQPNGKTAYSSGEKGKSIEFGGVDLVVNVIGSAQRYPQMVLKETFKAIDGEETANRIVHVSYGEVGISGGTLSGREGGWIGDERNYTADDLLSEMKKKTLEVVENSEKIKEKGNEGEIAAKIALSAIKFEFLRIDPEKKVTFEWDKALDLNSNSGPYCMYMYARASSILEKSEINISKMKLKKEDYSKVERSYDFELVKLIGSGQEKIEKACREYRPDIIADYLIELSMLFGKFYEHMPVLKSEESKNIRIAIVWATRQAIDNMLNILGINTVEKM